MTIYLLDSMAICTGPVELPVIPGLGDYLPSNAIELEGVLPQPARGNVWVWRNGTTVQIADNRGSAYDTKTGKEEQWTQLGELPENLTLEPPPGLHYEWTKKGWRLGELAERSALMANVLSERDGLLYEASLRIAPLLDAIELGKAALDERAALLQWRSYRVDLDRIEDQSGFPADVQWPEKPKTRLAR